MEYTILDASNDFAKLSNSIGRYKESLCINLNIDFDSQDFRLVALDSIQQNLLSLASYIRAFVKLQELVSPEEFINILNVGINSVEEYENSGLVYKFPIESLVTMSHFKIDALFGEICKQQQNPKTGFYNRMKEVIGYASLEHSKRDDLQNTLQCLAFFRNSFHSGGFHTIDRRKWTNGQEPSRGAIDRRFSFDGHNIEFKHKELISYDWKSVFLLIQAAIEGVQQLISEIYECHNNSMQPTANASVD